MLLLLLVVGSCKQYLSSDHCCCPPTRRRSAHDVERVAPQPAGGGQVRGALLHPVHPRQADQPAAGAGGASGGQGRGVCMQPPGRRRRHGASSRIRRWARRTFPDPSRPPSTRTAPHNRWWSMILCPARRVGQCSTRMRRSTSRQSSGPAPSATHATTSRRTTRVRKRAGGRARVLAWRGSLADWSRALQWHVSGCRCRAGRDFTRSAAQHPARAPALLPPCCRRHQRGERAGGAVPAVLHH